MFSKLENLANQIILKCWHLLVALFYKIVPSRVLTFCQNIKLKMTNKINHLKVTIVKYTNAIFIKIKFKLSQLKSIDFKEQIASTKATLKHEKDIFNLERAKKYLSIVKEKSHAFARMIQGKLVGQPLTLYASLSIGLFASGYGLYHYSNKIINKSGLRKPASIQQPEMSIRPTYYKMGDKFYLISDVYMPIYLKGEQAKALRIDLHIQASNRTARKFIQDKEYLIRDYILSRVEPFTYSMPFEDEGKQVIKEKVLKDLNALLKTHKVEGHIEDIGLEKVLGG